MDKDLQEIVNGTLRENMRVFLFVLEENGLPLPVIDAVDDGIVAAIWDKGCESLSVFFDDDGITAHWCSVVELEMKSEDKEYGIEEKDEEFLMYLKLKLREMGLS